MLCGYFDLFSGYNEISLAKSLATITDLTVVSSDRVSPIFSDESLEALGQQRRYPAGRQKTDGFEIVRYKSAELGSVLWSVPMARSIKSLGAFDLVIQMSPGQMFPVAGSRLDTRARIVVFPDNSAMWAHLSKLQRTLKRIAFSVSKGIAYHYMTSRATSLFGYTPNTLKRIAPFSSGRSLELVPLSYDPAEYFLSDELRTAARLEMAISSDQFLIFAPGKLAEQKGLETLIRSFEVLGNSFPDSRLVITGADERSYSRHFAKNVVALSKRSGDIRLEPFVSTQRMNALMNAADIAVWPSTPAITMQQAMGTGLWVVLPQSDIVSHLLDPSTGAYFDSNVEGALTETLREALARRKTLNEHRGERAAAN